MPDTITTVGLDLRYVVNSPRGYRRMMNWVRELVSLDTDLALRLFCEGLSIPACQDCFKDRPSGGQPARIISASRYLRCMHRPLLGHLRKLIPMKLDVMHFLTGDIWSVPSAKTVVTLHDLASFHYPQFFFKNSSEEKQFHDHINRVVTQADCVVTVSDWSRTDLLEFFPHLESRLVRVYQGVDPAFYAEEWTVEQRRQFQWNLGAERGYLLYCGGLDARKNIAFLLQAYAIYRKMVTNPRKLVIVGDPDQPHPGTPPLLEMICQNGLESSIILTGQISDSFLRRVYSAAALFVFPSLMEGFGYAPLEAMACGCPVLCSAAAALPETVGFGASVLYNDHPEYWATGMVELLEDPDKRMNLVENGFDRSMEFSWTECARSMARMYTRVARGEALN